MIRLDRKKAALAVAHSILEVIWFVLCGDYFDRLNNEAVARRAVNRLKALGYEVTLSKTA